MIPPQKVVEAFGLVRLPPPNCVPLRMYSAKLDMVLDEARFIMLSMELGFDPREVAQASPQQTGDFIPACRVCRSLAKIISYPDKYSQAICPDCCKEATHNDGETGHGFDYERSERGRICRYCGLPEDY